MAISAFQRLQCQARDSSRAFIAAVRAGFHSSDSPLKERESWPKTSASRRISATKVGQIEYVGSYNVRRIKAGVDTVQLSESFSRTR